MLQTYHPELGEVKPAATIEARLAHNGRHYFIYSKSALTGRGVTLLGIVQPGEMMNSRRDGWHHYKVTMAAFDRISAAADVAMEVLLD